MSLPARTEDVQPLRSTTRAGQRKSRGPNRSPFPPNNVQIPIRIKYQSYYPLVYCDWRTNGTVCYHHTEGLENPELEQHFFDSDGQPMVWATVGKAANYILVALGDKPNQKRNGFGYFHMEHFPRKWHAINYYDKRPKPLEDHQNVISDEESDRGRKRKVSEISSGKDDSAFADSRDPDFNHRSPASEDDDEYEDGEDDDDDIDIYIDSDEVSGGPRVHASFRAPKRPKLLEPIKKERENVAPASASSQPVLQVAVPDETAAPKWTETHVRVVSLIESEGTLTDADATEQVARLARSVDMRACDFAQRTLLDIAAEEGKIAIAKVIIAAGGKFGQNQQRRNAVWLAKMERLLTLLTAADLSVFLGANMPVKDIMEKNKSIFADAARAGPKSVPLLAAFLQVGAQVNSQFGDQNERTVLHIATEAKDAEAVSLLLRKKADIKQEDADKRTALHIAAANGSLQIAQELISRQASHNTKDRDGRTPVHLAAASGHVHVVKALVAAGADVNSDGEESPLSLATANGHLETVKYLLEIGANPNAKAPEGKLPICVALANDKHELITALAEKNAVINHPECHKVFRAAIESGISAAPMILIQSGIDINAGVPEQRHYLLVAARAGNLGVVRALLAREISTDIKNAALHTAISFNHPKIVKELLKANIHIEYKADDLTPLERAVTLKNEKIAKILLNNKAYPGSSTFFQYTGALYLAKKNSSMLALLKKYL